MLPLFCATRAATVVLALAEVAATKLNGQLSAVLAGELGWHAFDRRWWGPAGHQNGKNSCAAELQSPACFAMPNSSCTINLQCKVPVV